MIMTPIYQGLNFVYESLETKVTGEWQGDCQGDVCV